MRRKAGTKRNHGHRAHVPAESVIVGDMRQWSGAGFLAVGRKHCSRENEIMLHPANLLLLPIEERPEGNRPMLAKEVLDAASLGGRRAKKAMLRWVLAGLMQVARR